MLSLLLSEPLPALRNIFMETKYCNHAKLGYCMPAMVQHLLFSWVCFHCLQQFIRYLQNFDNGSYCDLNLIHQMAPSGVGGSMCLAYIIIVTAMNREEQVQAYEQAQEYLQNNNVHQLISQLLQQIILQKPANVLDFMISKLQAPQRFTLFVVGPPGLSINTIIRKALSQGEQQFELFNCGDEIGKSESAFGEQEKRRFRSCLLLAEESIEPIIGKVEKLCRADRNYIIEGFPKNIKQAHLLQSRKLSPKNLLFINIDSAGLQGLINEKVLSLNPSLSPEERAKIVAIAKMEHQINLNALKKFYNRYLEIDLSRDRSEAFIIKQLHKAFSIKTLSGLPRVSSQVIVVGAPFSGRTALGKKLAEHYGFVYISTSQLIAEEVRRDTVHGRRVRASYQSRQLVDDFLVEKLIQQRIARKDCRMQGFVLEGYPKNQQQFENMRNMKLSPTLIVAIDAPLDLLSSRSQGDPQVLKARYQKWSSFATFLSSSKEKVFWANPQLNIANLYEEVVHEFEKRFL